MSSEVDETKLLADAKKLPWDERVGHKNWKVRQDAYVDMAAACRAIHDPKDSKLRDFGKIRRPSWGIGCSQSQRDLLYIGCCSGAKRIVLQMPARVTSPCRPEDSRAKDVLLDGLQVSC